MCVFCKDRVQEGKIYLCTSTFVLSSANDGSVHTFYVIICLCLPLM